MSANAMAARELGEFLAERVADPRHILGCRANRRNGEGGDRRWSVLSAPSITVHRPDRYVVQLAPSDLPALPKSPHRDRGNRDPAETQGLPMSAVRNAIHRVVRGGQPARHERAFLAF